MKQLYLVKTSSAVVELIGMNRVFGRFTLRESPREGGNPSFEGIIAGLRTLSVDFMDGDRVTLSWDPSTTYVFRRGSFVMVPRSAEAFQHLFGLTLTEARRDAVAEATLAGGDPNLYIRDVIFGGRPEDPIVRWADYALGQERGARQQLKLFRREVRRKS
jgi:hypothetical protein